MEMMMPVDVKVQAAPEDVHLRTHVPLTATNLTGLLESVRELVAQAGETVERHLQAEGQRVSCRAGCGACCRQLVTVPLFEAEALAEWLRGLPAERLAELRGRFASNWAALAASGLPERLRALDWARDAEGRQRLSREYFRLGVACPFLEEESCSIYAIRPLICREYQVISAPELCADAELEGVVTVGFRLRFARVLEAVGAEHFPQTQGWILLAELMAWMEQDLHPGEAVSGKGPEVLMELMRFLPSGEDHGASVAPGA